MNTRTFAGSDSTSRDKDAPFFVLGCGRSGTTLLRVILDEHPRLTVPRESLFLIKLMDELPLRDLLTSRQIEQAFQLVSRHQRWIEWEISNESLRVALERLERPRLGNLIDAVFGLHTERTGKPRWGDKTPGYVLHMDRLHKVFPNAKFIHIIRDARDVCLSHRNAGWGGPLIHNTAQFWDETVRIGRAAGRLLPQHLYHEVAYEDLVLDQEAIVRRICEFLEEGYHRRMLSFHERAVGKVHEREKMQHTKLHRPSLADDVDRWQQELNLLQVGVVEAFAGETMERVGQQLRFRRQPLRALGRLVGGLLKATKPIRGRLGLTQPGFRRIFGLLRSPKPDGR